MSPRVWIFLQFDERNPGQNEENPVNVGKIYEVRGPGGGSGGPGGGSGGPGGGSGGPGGGYGGPGKKSDFLYSLNFSG